MTSIARLLVGLAFGVFLNLANAATLVSGPMVGAPAMRAAKVWLQADAPARAEIEYWDVQLPNKITRSLSVQLAREFDFTDEIEIGGLTPGHTYGYRVLLNGKAQRTAVTTQFKTLVQWKWRSDAPDWKLALGSCAYVDEAEYDRLGKPYGGGEEGTRIYGNIAAQKPDLMLWGGDNVYFREADWDSEWGLRARWKHSRALPALQPLLQTGAHVAIWDDHDYGPNNANSSYGLKATTTQLFKRYFANQSYGLPELPGMFGSFSMHDADFFLTDGRTFRDSDDLKSPDKAMLGAGQMRWLKNALLASVAPIKLIVMGSQVTNDLLPEYREGWANFPAERDAFLQFLVDHKIEGVVLLTGDRHFTALYKTERPGSYPLHELTCSPLSAGPISNPGPEKTSARVVPNTFVTERNFCTIEFTGPQKNRALTLKSFSTTGEKKWEQSILLNDLKTPKSL